MTRSDADVSPMSSAAPRDQCKNRSNRSSPTRVPRTKPAPNPTDIQTHFIPRLPSPTWIPGSWLHAADSLPMQGVLGLVDSLFDRVLGLVDHLVDLVLRVVDLLFGLTRTPIGL